MQVSGRRIAGRAGTRRFNGARIRYVNLAIALNSCAASNLRQNPTIVARRMREAAEIMGPAKKIGAAPRKSAGRGF